MEVYFDDCYDLLNNKAEVPIAGFGAGVKAKPGMACTALNENKYDENGKWIPPMRDGQSLNPTKKRTFETKGQTWKEITNK